MKFFFFIIILFLHGCSKPKTVLICGDHICVNKKEAEQFFEENLSIEVKIINKKINNNNNLVELNLRKNSDNKRIVSIKNKESTKTNIKILTNDEIETIKLKIKKKNHKKKKNKIVKKITNEQKIKGKIFEKKKNKSIPDKNTTAKIKIVNKKRLEVVDVCTILEKCSIDNISKFLLKEGKRKKFPDITSR
jgi:hypothetical protein